MGWLDDHSDPAVIAAHLDAFDHLPFYELNALGMPLPGPDFMAHAVSLGDTKPAVTGVRTSKKLVVHGPVLTKLYRAALYSSEFALPVKVKGRLVSAKIHVGHCWDSKTPTGPIEKCKVMVIGKWPGSEEVRTGLNLSGESGKLLKDCLQMAGMPPEAYRSWYVTNLVRHTTLDVTKSSPAKSWINNCAILLEQELRLVRPDFVLCLGAEASNYMLRNEAGSKTNTHGAVFTGKVQINTTPEGEPVEHVFQLMTCLHPAAVLRGQTDKLPELQGTVRRFVELVQGNISSEKEDLVTDYRIVSTELELKQIVDDIILEHQTSGKPTQAIALDCEWHGEYWTSVDRPLKELYGGRLYVDPAKGEMESWQRTIQFSHKPGFGVAVVLRHGGRRNRDGSDRVGTPAFVPSIASAVTHLKRLFTDTPEREVRLVGHHLRADLPWITKLDKDLGDLLIRKFDPPGDDPDPDGENRLYGHQKLRHHGGFDTMYAMHSVQETSERKLEVVAMSLCGMRRYDGDVQKDKQLLADELTRMGQGLVKGVVKVSALPGYGELTDNALLPYSIRDVDATIRIYEEFVREGGLLDRDQHGNPSWIPFWLSQRKLTAELEMEMNGLQINYQRAEKLAFLYREAGVNLLAKLRDLIGWAEFNPNSHIQVKTVLFGPEMSGKQIDVGGDPDPRPMHARNSLVLNLCPIKTSGKPSKDWNKIRDKDVHLYTPSTDKEVLGILLAQALAASNPVAVDLLKTLRHYRFVSRILSSVLSSSDAAGMQVDEDGDLVFDKGFLASVEWDKRVRTHFLPIETGRVSSARPNIQSLSKRREKDLKDILGSKYVYPTRSMIESAEGRVFIEADFTGAELMMMAVQSGSRKMVDHCQRANLKDGDPNQYDIHSTVAVQAFNLKVTDHIPEDKNKNPDKKTASQLLGLPVGSSLPPLKKALWAIGCEYMRDIAKCVVAGSRLLTTGGWVKVEDLCGHLAEDQAELYTGDLKVISDVGITPLIGVYNGGIKPCVKVTSDDGHTLTTSVNHQFRIVGESGDYAWRKASELKPSDWMAVLDSPVVSWVGDATFPRYECEQNTSYKDLDFPEEFNEDWAAFMGLYLSEACADPVGGVLQLALAVEIDPQFGRLSEELLKRLFGDRVKVSAIQKGNHQRQVKFTISAVKLARWLHQHCPGYAAEKYVPEFVFRWPQHLQCVFLKWLFEGDGSGSRNGRGFKVTYATSSLRLANDVQTLLTGLGVYSDRSEETRTGHDRIYQVVRLKYNSSRKVFAERVGFLTKLKHDRLTSTVSYELDWSEIPNQEQHLRNVFQHLHGKARDKCYECLRSRNTVRLNQTRLSMIVEYLSNKALPADAAVSYQHLKEMIKPVRFVQVRSVEEVTPRQVYDVQTTEPHSVVYDSCLSHQTIAFGIPYGRGDDAVVRAVEELGIRILSSDVAKIRGVIFGNYPELEGYFESCHHRVYNQGHIVTCFGRRRRFQLPQGVEDTSDLERQAGNLPIQGGVADVTTIALHNFRHYPGRYREDGVPRFILAAQIHDAIMSEVLVEDVPWYVNTVLPDCMSHGVTIYHCDLDGNKLSKEEFHLGFDYGISKYWGEKLTREQALELKLPEEFVPKK